MTDGLASVGGVDGLVAVPGIGPTKAQAIVDHRSAHGPFKSVDDLKSVKGIGAKRLEKLRPELTVGPAPANRQNATRWGQICTGRTG